jgi:hypothetical protein
MTEAPDPLRRIRVAQAEQAVSFRERVFNEALELLREDLRNLPQAGAQATYRANAVGLALLDARLYGAAAELYERLVTEIKACINPTEQVHTCTLLHCNWGVALALVGDHDRAMPHLMTFRTIAEQTGTPYDRYIANVHLEDRFERPALRILTWWAYDVYWRAYGKRIDQLLVKECFSQLGDGRYIAFAAALAIEDLWRSHYDRPTPYTSWALLARLRTLATALEELANALCGSSQGGMMLWDCCARLLRKTRPELWQLVENNRPNTHYKGWKDFEKKLTALLQLDDRGHEAFYAKSLCVALLVRNFVSHDLLPSPNLTSTDLFPPVKCHLAAAFVALHLAALHQEPPAEESRHDH